MKWRFALALLVLAAFVSSTKAQTANCTTVQIMVTSNDITLSPLGVVIKQVRAYEVTCLTTGSTILGAQRGIVYSVQDMTFTGTGTGVEAGNGSRYVVCNPIWSQYVRTPTNGGRGYVNSGTAVMLLQLASPGPPPGSNPPTATGYCADGSTQTVTKYCATYACYSSGGGTPIVVDVTGKGFFLTDAHDGVLFDLSGTGHPVQMGWTAGGADNAFLALPGPDGLVHNGQQLFGNFTPQPPSDTPNGFAALAVYDQPSNGGNGDGIIDARDAIFSSLRLWIDANHDGISQPEELHALPSLGINSISLSYKASEKTDQYGNVFRYRAQLNPDKPTEAGKIVYDVIFVTNCSANPVPLAVTH